MKKVLYLLMIFGMLLHGCADQHLKNTATTTTTLPKRAEVLFLGHTSKHHDSYKYAPLLATAVFKSGINITYTDKLTDLNTENLAKYDGLVIYANYDTISTAQETALKAFVESGKGLIPLHCASFCFQNSNWYVNAVGGQFKTHTTGRFSATIVNSKHPVMQDVSAFDTWDETYVHSKLNPDKTVLTERVEGSHHEPYTWVRKQGKGRVFYTAYGHNDSTWTNREFLKLVKNGVLWALGDSVAAQLTKLQVPQGVYTDAQIPNYENRDPAPKLQAPFTPAESQKLIQIPADFKLELFAAEPDIINPIAMNWDERGRLWVIETVDYPNEIRTGDGIGDDRIKICEDTDGDGKADKFTIFADKLNIPTSIVFANGGIIVAQAPNFVFLKDTNGDDKADIRENIITGWGKSDTHAGPSNLKYGFDNKIWGVLGYSGFDGTVGGKAMKFSQGVYQFTPDGKQLEYLGGTSNNTWGLGFSEENDVFISTANNTHSAFFGIPKRYVNAPLAGINPQSVKKIDGHYDMHVVFPNLRQVDVFGGFTAAAGHNLYTARNYPKNYWNHIAFVCEPTGRVVHQAVLAHDGAGFTESDGWNFLASADEWVGPVQAEVGPDGAVWVADWYDFIIQHNPTPRGFENGKGNAYINPLRDHEKGRIYRVVYKNAKPYTPVKLSKDDVPGLLAALQNDNMFWRMTAQRLLVESKNTAAIEGLINIINNKKQDEIGLSGPAVHALWVLKGINALDGNNQQATQAALNALTHPAPAVRKAAIQVLPKTPAALAALIKANLINDADARVRLAAILAVADAPADKQAGNLIYEAAADTVNAKDEWIAKALLAAATTQQKSYLTAFAKHTNTAESLNQRIYNAIEKTGDTAKAADNEGTAASNLPPVTLNLKVVEHIMQFDKKVLTVKAGQKVIINFENPDFMQHNWVLIKPGTTNKVGEAADALARDPKGAEKNYVPEIPEVIKATALLNPQQKVTIQFIAPAQAGSYPYICTFPGHWRIMNGILKVTK